MATKREWHCGWIPRTEWVEPCALPPTLGNAHGSVSLVVEGLPQVCPGYLARLPAVVEASKGHAAMRHGELSTVFPDLPNAVVEGALEVESSFSAFSSAQLKAVKR